MAVNPCDIVELIDTALKTRGTNGIQEYSIAGRRVKYDDTETLLKLRAFYSSKCEQKKRADEIAAGLGNRNKIKVQF